jgi:hypothetical protein
VPAARSGASLTRLLTVWIVAAISTLVTIETKLIADE